MQTVTEKANSRKKKAPLAVPEGYFAFSLPCEKENELDFWKGWFASKEIKTLIITNADGHFVLCREGKAADYKEGL